MGKLINTTTMTVDGVADVGEWFVAEGERDRAGRDQFDGAAGLLLGRKRYEGLVRREDVAGWLAEERARGTGDILTFGSRTMWNGLLEQGLVDEVHLMVGPSALGGATPIFQVPADLRLLDIRGFEGSDNLLLRYAAARR